MSAEFCNACGATCDEDQFNREGMGYCEGCFASSRNKAGAVDVLAVMKAAGISLILYPTSGPKPSEQLREARAAVAELIKADKEYDAALLALKDLNRKIAEQGWIEVEFDALRVAGMRLVKAQQRRTDALTNMGDIA